MNKYYLYCNSNATAVDGKTGFVKGYGLKRSVIKKKDSEYCSCYTTTEYDFAKEFNTLEQAQEYNDKYNLPCIIFERKDL